MQKVGYQGSGVDLVIAEVTCVHKIAAPSVVPTTTQAFARPSNKKVSKFQVGTVVLKR